MYPTFKLSVLRVNSSIVVSVPLLLLREILHKKYLACWSFSWLIVIFNDLRCKSIENSVVGYFWAILSNCSVSKNFANDDV